MDKSIPRTSAEIIPFPIKQKFNMDCLFDGASDLSLADLELAILRVLRGVTEGTFQGDALITLSVLNLFKNRRIKEMAQ